MIDGMAWNFTINGMKIRRGVVNVPSGLLPTISPKKARSKAVPVDVEGFNPGYFAIGFALMIFNRLAWQGRWRGG